MGGSRNFYELKMVITTPAFVIRIAEERLYYFRLLEEKTTLMVEVEFNNSVYNALAYIENPTIKPISELLKKGALYPFISSFM
jgi:hypothetical protein